MMSAWEDAPQLKSPCLAIIITIILLPLLFLDVIVNIVNIIAIIISFLLLFFIVIVKMVVGVLALKVKEMHITPKSFPLCHHNTCNSKNKQPNQKLNSFEIMISGAPFPLGFNNWMINPVLALSKCPPWRSFSTMDLILHRWNPWIGWIFQPNIKSVLHFNTRQNSLQRTGKNKKNMARLYPSGPTMREGRHQVKNGKTKVQCQTFQLRLKNKD